MIHRNTIEKKIERRLPIDADEAAILYHEASDDDLKKWATLVRNRFHPEDRATYVIMAIINYTNVCVAKCDYCAFYRLPHQSGTYLLSVDEVAQRVDRLQTLGGTLVGFNGGFHPQLRIHDYAKLFSELRKRYQNGLEFYEMTVAEFMFSCKVSKVSYDDGAAILKAAGTRWVTGGGAEILEDEFRARHSPGKYKVADYYAAQRAILRAGMGSTATMVIGFDETVAQRLKHLEDLRRFQDEESGRLASFLCWTYKPYHTELKGEEVSTEEYLRWLAVCRIYLHNFKHMRTSVLTKNEDALLGLGYGADDFDLPTEDEVTQKAGAVISLNFDNLLQAARNIGYEPVQRRPFDIPTGWSTY